MAAHKSEAKAERLRRLAAIMTEADKAGIRRPSFADVAKTLGYAVSTIRKDMEFLRASGAVPSRTAAPTARASGGKEPRPVGRVPSDEDVARIYAGRRYDLDGRLAR